MNSFGAAAELKTKHNKYKIYRLDKLTEHGAIDKLPYSIKILLENVLRNVDGRIVKDDDVIKLAGYDRPLPMWENGNQPVHSHG